MTAESTSVFSSSCGHTTRFEQKCFKWIITLVTWSGKHMEHTKTTETTMKKHIRNNIFSHFQQIPGSYNMLLMYICTRITHTCDMLKHLTQHIKVLGFTNISPSTMETSAFIDSCSATNSACWSPTATPNPFHTTWNHFSGVKKKWWWNFLDKCQCWQDLS